MNFENIYREAQETPFYSKRDGDIYQAAVYYSNYTYNKDKNKEEAAKYKAKLEDFIKSNRITAKEVYAADKTGKIETNLRPLANYLYAQYKKSLENKPKTLERAPGTPEANARYNKPKSEWDDIDWKNEFADQEREQEIRAFRSKWEDEKGYERANKKPSAIDAVKDYFTLENKPSFLDDNFTLKNKASYGEIKKMPDGEGKKLLKALWVETFVN